MIYACDGISLSKAVKNISSIWQPTLQSRAQEYGMLTLGDFVSARPQAPVIASLLARSNSMFLHCFSVTCIPIFA